MTEHDVRDERLAALLDDAVGGFGVEPERRLPSVVRRGSRRRAVNWTAVVTAIAVFVGGVTWAGFEVRSHQSTPLDVAPWESYRDPQGWSMRYPPGWHLATFENVCMAGFTGGMVANVPDAYRSPQRPNGCSWPPSMSTLPARGVAVEFDLMEGGPVGAGGAQEPDTPMPLSLEAAASVQPGSVPGVRQRFTLPVVNAGRRFTLNVWIGSKASGRDRDIAASIVSSITFGPDTADWATAGSLDTTGWAVRYAPNWRRQDLPACPNAPERAGLVVTNTDFAFGNPEGQPPGCGDRFVFDGFPGDGVAVAIEPVPIMSGVPGRPVNTPLPISWDQLEPATGIRGGPQESYLGIVARGDLMFSLRTWIGPEASADATAEVRATVASLDVVDATRWTTYRSDMSGYSLTYPDDWYRAEGSLTPALAAPREILSLATYPLRPGGKACLDAYLPGNALADLGPTDVFITVQESGAGTTSPPRPAGFGPSAAKTALNGLPACDGYRAIPLRGWWFAFRDQGRSFYAFAAVGDGVAHDQQVLRLVWHVLDSLRFDPS